MQVTQTLRKAAQVGSDRPLTIFGNRTRTAGEVIERVRLAGALHALGVAPGDRVAMLSLNSDRYLEYCSRCRGPARVLNPMNIRWSRREIAYSLNDCEHPVLLVDDTFAPVVPGVRGRARRPTVIHAGDGRPPEGMLSYEALVAGPSRSRTRAAAATSLAGVFYTGGTTGSPKGVDAQPRQPARLGPGQRGHRRVHVAGRRLLHAAPMFHLADRRRVGRRATSWAAPT